MIRYWIGVVSQSHVCNGVQGGFIQVCHGKYAPLKKMQIGDWFIYYSPKTDIDSKIPLQKFTAICKIVGESVYPFKMNEHFIPFRRDVMYVKCTPSSIKPLINKLSFIKDPQKWGLSFYYGHFEITKEDFEIIVKSMMVNFDEKI